MSQADLFSHAGLILCGVGAVGLNIFSRRVMKLGSVVLLYLGGSVLLLNVCSFQMCVALFICGVGSAVLLGTGNRTDEHSIREGFDRRNVLIFRLLLVIMLGVIAYAASLQVHLWIPVRRTVLFICIWISLMSLFSLSFENVMLNRCMHLQGICFAFTLSYIYMENSILVFACFTAINLLLAFGGALLTPDSIPVSEDPVEDEQ